MSSMIQATNDLTIVLCSGAEHLTDELSRAGFDVFNSGMNYDGSRFFTNGDIYTRLPYIEEFYNKRVCIIQSLASSGELDKHKFTTSDRTIELLQTLQILREPTEVDYVAGKREYRLGIKPSHILVICLHAAFSKQDQIYRTGELNANKHVFDLLYQHGADVIAVIDPHVPREFHWTEDLIRQNRLIFLSMYERIIDGILEDHPIDNVYFVSTPGKTRAKVGVELSEIYKKRISSERVELKGKIDDKLMGRNIFLFDDMVLTGTTIRGARKLLLDQGAKDIICWITHALPSLQSDESDLRSLVEAFQEKLYVSNTVRTATFERDYPYLLRSCGPLIIEFLNSY